MPVPGITLGSLFSQSVVAFRANFPQSFSIAFIGYTVTHVFSWSLGNPELMLEDPSPEAVSVFTPSLIAVFTVDFIIGML